MTAARLADRFAVLCQAIVSHHGGQVSELRGDEALAVFSSPRSALLAAVALQGCFRAELGADPTLPLRVGMGIDTGEVVPIQGGYRGRALMPDPTDLPDLEILSQYDAVAFFVERAQAVRPGFHITNENAPAVAEICYRLDGLPLAIELAAARIRLFPPKALLRRLSPRLPLLTGGASDRPTRQQTLRGAIDWSYSLLSEAEQALFARLSVFAGGCTFEAAEAICNPQDDLDLLEGMTSLVEKSLLRQDSGRVPRRRLECEYGDPLRVAGDPRFSMLETIREYAAERLAERREMNETWDAHAAYFLKMAREGEPELTGPLQEQWLVRFDAELDNLRAAPGWFLQRGQIEEELRLAIALFWFWYRRGHWSEERRWLEEGLARGDAVAESVRGTALGRLGRLAFEQGDYERATTLLLDALQLLQEVGDRLGRAQVLSELGIIAFWQGEHERATGFYEESLALARDAGGRRETALALGLLGIVAAEQGDHVAAMERLEGALALYREAGDIRGIAGTLINLGSKAERQGMLDEARSRYEEALRLSRDQGNKQQIALVLENLGSVAAMQGDHDQAAEHFRKSLVLSRELGAKRLIVSTLGDIADLATARGNWEPAARLGGAEAAQREIVGVPLGPYEREEREQGLERARQALGEEQWNRIWEQGQAMSLEEAAAYALGETE
jgi:predicted ATPase/Tfp pilus assembly protein PilF